ncbi:MAG: hypothetical protein RL318_690 [Fibrobacterota bacterium]|jgi:hypothetical protein
MHTTRKTDSFEFMSISKSLVYPRTHRFQIPVMGTGHSIDTPLRVARFGISSVVSLVDDILIEQVQRLYSQRLGVPFQPVPPSAPDARTQRVRNYFDFATDLVQSQIREMQAQAFTPESDKTRYFEMLPESSPLKQDYLKMLALPAGSERESLAQSLTRRMEPGSIDANIMTKLDRRPAAKDGTLSEASLSDAKTALRGFALSKNRGNMIFSAGINPTLYGLIEEFPDFYRTSSDEPAKGIIIKVSDFRSAMVQGRFLAKKGLEVREFRIESGLNCGGHAFASEGDVLGPILGEFQKSRSGFPAEFSPHIEGYFRKKGREIPEGTREHEAAVTVQGGLGNSGEQSRMFEFGVDATGWGSPFLLVSEATPVDDFTRELLRQSTGDDLFLSDASPLGVPFNNLRTSSAIVDIQRLIDAGRPGSACPKGFLVTNTEFSTAPICTASSKYQSQKLETIGGIDAVDAPKVLVKECICHQLGNGALAFLAQENKALKGEIEVVASRGPVSVCPGPNLAWFDRFYSLKEMIDHIYGRIPSLVSANRPHCFAAELEMNVREYQKLLEGAAGNAATLTKAERTRVALLESISWYRQFLATTTAIADENLESLAECLDRQEAILAIAEPAVVLS